MKKLIFLTLFAFGIMMAKSPDAVPDDGCYTCHLEVDEDMDDDEKITSNILEDIHIQRGLSCADCHGGDPEAEGDEDEAMWDNESFRGAIPKEDQPEVCGACHADPAYMRQYDPSMRTDQLAQYWTSNHGKALKDGITEVAVCTSCHDVHGIRSVDDPRSTAYPFNIPETCGTCHSDNDIMAKFDIPTDQLEKYKNSVHGIALFEKGDMYAPTCNDCHGNHGAVPPDVGHITDVCGTCHVNNKSLFQESHMSEGFLKQGISQCISCHNNHEVLPPSDEMLKWSDESMCIDCHKDGGKAKEMSLYFYNKIDSLKTEMEDAGELLEKAEMKGMEISDLLIKMEEAHNVLIQTRTSIHSFNKETVDEKAKPGFESAAEAKKGAIRALDNFKFRQKGLFAFSLILSLFVVTFYFKIRDIDKRKK